MGKPPAAAGVDVSQAGETQAIRHLRGTPSPGFFVEIGANDGYTFSTTYGLMVDGWAGVCVEPNTRVFERLQTNIARFPRVVGVRCACAPFPGPVKLYYGKNDPLEHMSTICTDDSPWFRANRGEEYEVVEAKPLSMLMDELRVPPEFDLLLVDAEGMDLEILKTSDFARYRPKLIVTEDYEPKNPEKFALLEAAGYSFRMHVGCNTFWLGSADVLSGRSRSTDSSSVAGRPA